MVGTTPEPEAASTGSFRCREDPVCQDGPSQELRDKADTVGATLALSAILPQLSFKRSTRRGEGFDFLSYTHTHRHMNAHMCHTRGCSKESLTAWV